MNSVRRVEVVRADGTFLDAYMAPRGMTIHDVSHRHTNDRERCEIMLGRDGTAYVTVLRRARAGKADGQFLAASCAALVLGYFVLIPVCEALLHLSLILNRIGV